MTVAMQRNTCTKNAINLKHMIVVAFKINEKDVHDDNDLISKLATCSEYQFGMIEIDLNRHHTTEEVQHAMKILHLIKLCYSVPIKSNNEINAARVSRRISIYSFHPFVYLLLQVSNLFLNYLNLRRLTSLCRWQMG